MPTPAVLDPAIGRNLVLYITPLIKNGPVFESSGYGPYSFVGYFQDVDYEISLATENLSPVGAFNANPVPHEQSGRWQITEFTFALPTVASVAPDVWEGGNILRTCANISYYQLIEAQLWDNDVDPEQVDDFIMYAVMTGPIHRTASKPRAMDAGVFELLPLYDSSSGDFLANPSFGSYNVG